MNFEQALQQASVEYLTKKGELSVSDVEKLFAQYFPVLQVSGNNRKHNIKLPGPNLWLRNHGKSDSKMLDRYHEKYPEGSGKDGLITLEFLEGDTPRKAFYVNIICDSYLMIPKNSIKKPDLTNYDHVEETDYIDDCIWVNDPKLNLLPGVRCNFSEHGVLIYLWQGDFQFFEPSTKVNENSKDIAKLFLTTTHNLPINRVRYIRSQILTNEESEIDFYTRQCGAHLGDGALTAFLKHMGYDTDFNSIAK